MVSGFKKRDKIYYSIFRLFTQQTTNHAFNQQKELPYSNYEYDLEFYKGYFALMYFLRYYRHYGYRGISDPNQLKFEFYI